MELLRDVGLEWIQAQRGRRDTGKPEQVGGEGGLGIVSVEGELVKEGRSFRLHNPRMFSVSP